MPRHVLRNDLPVGIDSIVITPDHIYINYHNSPPAIYKSVDL